MVDVLRRNTSQLVASERTLAKIAARYITGYENMKRPGPGGTGSHANRLRVLMLKQSFPRHWLTKADSRTVTEIVLTYF